MQWKRKGSTHERPTNGAKVGTNKEEMTLILKPFFMAGKIEGCMIHVRDQSYIPFIILQNIQSH